MWGNPLFFTDLIRFGTYSGSGYLPMTEDEDSLFTEKLLWFDIASTYGDSGSGIFNAATGELIGVLSIGTDPMTRPFHMAGAFPLAFTRKQLRAII